MVGSDFAGIEGGFVNVCTVNFHQRFGVCIVNRDVYVLRSSHAGGSQVGVVIQRAFGVTKEETIDRLALVPVVTSDASLQFRTMEKGSAFAP